MVQISNPLKELPVQNEKYIKNCIELYMAHKGIEKIDHFNKFVNIEILWLNNNKIEMIENLDSCIRIKKLYLQNNYIRKLDESILKFKFLNDIRLSNNYLKDLHETLEILSKCRYLQHLDLFGNPLSEEPNYRLFVIASLPLLLVFDSHVVTSEERKKAEKLIRKSNKEHSINKTNMVKSNEKIQSGCIQLLEKEVKKIEKLKKLKDTSNINNNNNIKQNEEIEIEKKLIINDTNQKKVLVEDIIDFIKKRFSEYSAPIIDLETFDLGINDIRENGYIIEIIDKESNHLLDTIINSLNCKNQLNDCGIHITSNGISWSDVIQAFTPKLDKKYYLCVRLIKKYEAKEMVENLFKKALTFQKKAMDVKNTDEKHKEFIKKAFEYSQRGYRLEALFQDDKNDYKTINENKLISKDVHRKDEMSIFSYHITPKINKKNSSEEEIREKLQNKYCVDSKILNEYDTKKKEENILKKRIVTT